MLFRTLILLGLLSSFNLAFAQLKDMQTTRLLGTGGTGVGSILMTEAALLNPASIAFFSSSSFYYQKWNSSLDEKSEDRTQDYSEGSGENIIISDTSSQAKGTFLYQNFRENGFSRTRFASSMAAPIGKKTALGIIYRYTMDKTPTEHVKPYHQGVIGLTHIYSPKLSFGATLEDPFRSKKEDAIATFGAQYGLTESLYLMGDVGSNYLYDISKHAFNRLAVQLKTFGRLYLRAGTFFDKNDQEKGNAYGISWIGPKLSLEYAYKKAEYIGENTDYVYEGEKFEEMSFSISINI